MPIRHPSFFVKIKSYEDVYVLEEVCKLLGYIDEDRKRVRRLFRESMKYNDARCCIRVGAHGSSFYSNISWNDEADFYIRNGIIEVRTE